MAPAEQHPVVTRDECLAARKRHLIREQELTRMLHVAFTPEQVASGSVD